MKIKKFLKQFAAIIMVFAILSAIPSNVTPAKASYSPVHMYCCDNVFNWRGSIQYNVYIQIDANSAKSKEVYVHYKGTNDEWVDSTASYVTNLDSNTEIWVATVTAFASGWKYAIKYIGDGITYWDNNNGNDYTPDDQLGVANVLAERLHYQSANNYVIQVVVKNLGNPKTVKVIYTQDNWNTCQETNLEFYENIPNTNNERWRTTLSLDSNKMDSFHYCIKYEVNGQTYWDNNFGANYSQDFRRPL